MKKLTILMMVFAMILSTNLAFAAEENSASTDSVEVISDNEGITNDSAEETTNDEAKEITDDGETWWINDSKRIINKSFKAPRLKAAAADPFIGQTIVYTCTEVNGKNGTVGTGTVFNANGYPGLCCRIGKPHLSTGLVKVTQRIPTTSLTAKVLYKYAYLQNWHTSTKNGFNGLCRACCVMRMEQYAYQGEAVARPEMEKYSKKATVNKIINAANDCQSVVVPDNFMVYATECVDASGNIVSRYQPCIFWFMGSTPVNLQIKKNVTSANMNVVAQNPLYSVDGTTFALYSSPAEAQGGVNAKASFGITNGQSNVVSINPGVYYLVETGAGPGLIIPSELQAQRGGKEIAVSTNTTIDITETAPIGTYNVRYQYKNADSLPQDVMDTLPASYMTANGSAVTAVSPSATEIITDEGTYTFEGWNNTTQYINNSDVTFIGSWVFEPVDIPDEEDDALTVTYTYENIDNLPTEVVDTLPKDVDAEGEPTKYTIGDTIIPKEPSELTVTIDGDEYRFTGWDKDSATFTSEEAITFIGTWELAEQ